MILSWSFCISWKSRGASNVHSVCIFQGLFERKTNIFFPTKQFCICMLQCDVCSQQLTVQHTIVREARTHCLSIQARPVARGGSIEPPKFGPKFIYCLRDIR